MSVCNVTVTKASKKPLIILLQLTKQHPSIPCCSQAGCHSDCKSKDPASQRLVWSLSDNEVKLTSQCVCVQHGLSPISSNPVLWASYLPAWVSSSIRNRQQTGWWELLAWDVLRTTAANRQNWKIILCLLSQSCFFSTVLYLYFLTRMYVCRVCVFVYVCMLYIHIVNIFFWYFSEVIQ